MNESQNHRSFVYSVFARVLAGLLLRRTRRWFYWLIALYFAHRYLLTIVIAAIGLYKVGGV